MLTDLNLQRLRKSIIRIMQEYGIKVNRKGEIEAYNLRELQFKIALKMNQVNTGGDFFKYIATPSEIDIDNIKPVLIPVIRDREAKLWRYAISYWSVPVTTGYGRRMRFLIMDAANGKLIGILGLCDPIIGLGVRDRAIGWDKGQKMERIYNMMTAYVLGAVPPYNIVMGSKLVALMCQSVDIVNLFKQKYEGKETIIQGKVKPAELVLIDTMGAFGKSAIYNRLQGWKFIGYTKGQSHLHLTVPEIWEIAKKVVDKEKFATYKFGQGPNWKMRVIKLALSKLGFKEDILEIGWKRGYYICPLAENWREYLLGEVEKPMYITKTIPELTEYWYGRWINPRKERLKIKLKESQKQYFEGETMRELSSLRDAKIISTSY